MPQGVVQLMDFAKFGQRASQCGSLAIQQVSKTPFTRPFHAAKRNTRQSGGYQMAARASNESRGGLRLLEWTGNLVPQGLLVKGAKSGWNMLWKTFMTELAPQSEDGEYTRPSYNLRHKIGDPDFPVEAGRYVVFIGNACPWCHRVLLTLILRNLLPSIQVVRMADDPERASRDILDDPKPDADQVDWDATGGWVFDEPDPVFGCNDLREVYDLCQPGFRGRCTAPLLVDRVQRRLISNESADVVRNLNTVDLPGAADVDLCPPHLTAHIDEINDLIYNQINNGVYKSGFATTQTAYDRAQEGLYSALNHVEVLLEQNRFLLGNRFTEADLRLYPTIIRYDSAYAPLFKCSRKRVSDYPHLNRWFKDVYNLQSTSAGMQIKDSYDVQEGMRSYFLQLFPLNPSGILPSGPTLEDLNLELLEADRVQEPPFYQRA